jgi:Fe-S cluster assembly ATP-binding protein
VTEGEVIFEGENLLDMAADERSRAGMFLSFQYPFAVPGVTVANFIRMAVNAHRKGGPDGADDPIRIPEFRKQLQEAMELLEIDKSMASRSLNDGFSGGEKKRFEILQMAMLKPKIAVLDETDSGLDIDALRIVSGGINALMGPDMGTLIITHYQRILDYVQPDRIHVLVDGRIVRSGGPELAKELETTGYAELAKEAVS